MVVDMIFEKQLVVNRSVEHVVASKLPVKMAVCYGPMIDLKTTMDCTERLHSQSQSHQHLLMPQARIISS